MKAFVRVQGESITIEDVDDYKVEAIGQSTILKLLKGEDTKAVIKHWQYFKFVEEGE